MKFSILTLFPKAFDSYLNTSILKRAQAKELIDIDIIDIRNFIRDKHKTADDKPYGGGPGMVMKAEPILKAIESIKQSARNASHSYAGGKAKKEKRHVVIFDAAGKQFTDKMASRLARTTQHLVLIAGHYEGVDERIKKILKPEEVSVGPYVLTGGELAALIIVDAVGRKLPGVLGKGESLEEKRYGIGVPVYTRPEIIVWPPKKGKKYSVPKVLLSGDHKKIEEWRKLYKKITPHKGV